MRCVAAPIGGRRCILGYPRCNQCRQLRIATDRAADVLHSQTCVKKVSVEPASKRHISIFVAGMDRIKQHHFCKTRFELCATTTTLAWHDSLAEVIADPVSEDAIHGSSGRSAEDCGVGAAFGSLR